MTLESDIARNPGSLTSERPNNAKPVWMAIGKRKRSGVLQLATPHPEAVVDTEHSQHAPVLEREVVDCLGHRHHLGLVDPPSNRSGSYVLMDARRPMGILT